MKLITLLFPYIIALILTIIIEGILCWLFLRDKAWLRFTCLINLFTNPLVNFVYTVIYHGLEKQGVSDIAPRLLFFLELAVWLLEALLLYQFSNHREPLSSIYKALLFSFVLNAATYGTGLLLQL